MTTDFRALCAELLADYEQHLYRSVLADKARAALAEPEPEGPTPQPADGEVAELAAWLRERGQERETLHLPGAELSKQLRTAPFLLTRAADLLERLSPPQPIAVSEHLPGPGDCDEQGRCWLCGKVEGDWRLINPEKSGVPQLKYCFSHWLPAHALPLLS